MRISDPRVDAVLKTLWLVNRHATLDELLVHPSDAEQFALDVAAESGLQLPVPLLLRRGLALRKRQELPKKVVSRRRTAKAPA